jgi:hypothetical protein
MFCVSRITDERVAQRFGDGKHNFYVEALCNYPCVKGQDVCAKCIEKNDACRIQGSRKFNHGKVNEPIPDVSHIFGGKWYLEKVGKWGDPPQEIVQFALQYQREAREGVEVSYKDEMLDTIKEMPRGKKTDVEGQVEKPKRGRKPRIVEDSVVETVNTVEESSVAVPAKTPKKRAPPKESPLKGRKRGEKVTPIIEPSPEFKEATLATHIEKEMEEVNTEDYEVEVVKLYIFEFNNTTYLREPIKNKLYKKVKDSVGQYVGRYHAETDSIDVEIPDSDDEN